MANPHRRLIHCTCTVHGGTPGFANLVVTNVRGAIVLDPHVSGACVIWLDESGAVELRAALSEWLE